MEQLKLRYPEMASDNIAANGVATHQDFASFYTPIKAHYNVHSISFKTFKSSEGQGVRGKIRNLLANEVVRTQVESLISEHEIGNDDSVEHFVPDVGLTATAHKQRHKFLNTNKVRKCVMKGKGRCLIATQNIQPGEVIIDEEPYVSVLYPQFFESHCQNCFQLLNCGQHGEDKSSRDIQKVVKSSSKIFKCSRCLMVNYCSESCMSENLSRYHFIECKANLLKEWCDTRSNKDSISDMAMLSLRIVTQTGLEAIHKHFGREPVKENSKLEKSDDDYQSVLDQVTNETSRECGEIFKRILMALYITVKVANIAGIDETSTTKNAKWSKRLVSRKEMKSVDEFRQIGDVYLTEVALAVIEALVHHMMSSSCNAYEISQLNVHQNSQHSDHFTNYESIELGGAVYPLISLTNHSCVQNTCRYNYDGVKAKLLASRQIKKGEEIFDNYGQFFQVEQGSLRRSRLKEQYHFKCECKACVEKWPTLAEMRSVRMKNQLITCVYCGYSKISDEKNGGERVRNNSKGSSKKMKRCPKCEADIKFLLLTNVQLGDVETHFLSYMQTIIASEGGGGGEAAPRSPRNLNSSTQEITTKLNNDNAKVLYERLSKILSFIQRNVDVQRVMRFDYRMTLLFQLMNLCKTVSGNLYLKY